MRSLVAACAALPLAVALASCGDATTTVAAQPAAHSYDGPLYVDRDHARHPKAGAAGDVVDCDTWGTGGFEDANIYGEGATADSPDGALEVARSEWGFQGVQDGFTVAKREKDRVLYVVEVGGAVKQALIVRYGPATNGAGGDGWYLESWAVCDFAELPRSYTDSIGLQVWSDAHGKEVPTKVLHARPGPEHCDWQSMIFLTIGKHTWVRQPQEGLDDFFADPYDPHTTVPADAIDTGYQHEGDHLWLAADKRFAYVGQREDAEAWPREVRLLGCD